MNVAKGPLGPRLGAAKQANKAPRKSAPDSMAPVDENAAPLDGDETGQRRGDGGAPQSGLLRKRTSNEAFDSDPLRRSLRGPGGARPSAPAAPAKLLAQAAVAPAPKRAIVQPHLVAPAEAMAQFVGIMAMAAERLQPEFASAPQRMLATYLRTPTDLRVMVAIGQASARTLRYSGDQSSAERIETIMKSALRDPAPYLQTARNAVAEATFGHRRNPVVSRWLHALGPNNVSFLDEPALAMDEAIRAISQVKTEIESRSKFYVDAITLLERRAVSLSDKTERVSLLTTTAQASGHFAEAGGLDIAYTALRLPSLMADAYSYYAAMGQHAAATVDLGKTYQQLTSRVAILTILKPLFEDLVEGEEEALTAAIAGETIDTAAFDEIDGGQHLLYLCTRLDPEDRLAMANLSSQGAYLSNVAKRLINEAMAPSYEPMSPLEQKRLQQMAMASKARAPMEAIRVIRALDAFEPVVAELDQLLSGLTPAPAAQNDALSQRAFETLLSARLLEKAPESTLTTWSTLGLALEQYIDKLQLDSDEAMVLSRELRDTTLHRGHRSWDAGCPQMLELVQRAYNPNVSGLEFLASASALLRAPAKTGYDVAAKVDLVRTFWGALQEIDVAPAMDAAADDYESLVERARDRVQNLTTGVSGGSNRAVGPNKPRAATGIMALHQPLPEPQPKAIAASQPGLVSFVGLNSSTVREALSLGAPVVTGVSGTTNIMLHFFDWVRRAPASPIGIAEIRDVALGTTMFVTADGGHSAQEVLWVFEHALGGAYAFASDHSSPQSLAQLQSAFADDPQMDRAMKDAAKGLGKFHLEIAQKNAARRDR